VGVLILIFLAAGGAYGVYRFFSLPVSSDNNAPQVTLVIERGESTREVAAKLFDRGLIKSKKFAYYYARLHKISIKAGIYPLSSSMNLSTIMNILELGLTENVVIHIPEGFTVSKIARVLEAEGICDAAEFIEAARDAEGFLFPDTYYLTENMAPATVVAHLRENFDRRVADIPKLANADEEEQRRIVTLASIVEREYRRPEEAPLIASVFENRLSHRIGLYSCATIEYIKTEILGEEHPEVILFSDLEIDNPYNTYMYQGLPPGPIANPGLVALGAAADPPATPYYYFRLVNPATGEHHFSTDYNEHLEAGTFLYTKGY
jgi:UPF0755 protein